MAKESDNRKNVESLIVAAATAEKADDAMKFAQAALNAANALVALEAVKPIGF